MPGGKEGVRYPLAGLQAKLALDSAEQTAELCEALGLEVALAGDGTCAVIIPKVPAIPYLARFQGTSRRHGHSSLPTISSIYAKCVQDIFAAGVFHIWQNASCALLVLQHIAGTLRWKSSLPGGLWCGDKAQWTLLD